MKYSRPDRTNKKSLKREKYVLTLTSRFKEIETWIFQKEKKSAFNLEIIWSIIISLKKNQVLLNWDHHELFDELVYELIHGGLHPWRNNFPLFLNVKNCTLVGFYRRVKAKIGHSGTMCMHRPKYQIII